MCWENFQPPSLTNVVLHTTQRLPLGRKQRCTITKLKHLEEWQEDGHPRATDQYKCRRTDKWMVQQCISQTLSTWLKETTIQVSEVGVTRYALGHPNPISKDTRMAKVGIMRVPWHLKPISKGWRAGQIYIYEVPKP